jgi:predicted dehydrogenase
MGKTLRWGIMGTGWIADRFARDLERLDGQVVAAVGSRTSAKAAAFAAAHPGRAGTPRAVEGYAALAAAPDVDIVYVATPHPGHYPHARLALEAGKPVLVEKPFTLDAAEAAELIGLARAKGLFLMEAMWTRFLPHMARIRALLDAGALGRLVAVYADHGQYFPPDPAHRLYNLELGGGALLDLGVYPVSFASMVLGDPESVTAVGDFAATGADAQTSMLLRYASGAQAVLTTTLLAASPNRAVIVGDKARIEIDGSFYCPNSFRLVGRDGKVAETYANDYVGHGLREQAAECAKRLASGETESPLLPLEETLAVMRTLDEVRRQIGLEYGVRRT